MRRTFLSQSEWDGDRMEPGVRHYMNSTILVEDAHSHDHAMTTELCLSTASVAFTDNTTCLTAATQCSTKLFQIPATPKTLSAAKCLINAHHGQENPMLY